MTTRAKGAKRPRARAASIPEDEEEPAFSNVLSLLPKRLTIADLDFNDVGVVYSISQGGQVPRLGGKVCLVKGLDYGPPISGKHSILWNGKALSKDDQYALQEYHWAKFNGKCAIMKCSDYTLAFPAYRIQVLESGKKIYHSQVSNVPLPEANVKVGEHINKMLEGIENPNSNSMTMLAGAVFKMHFDCADDDIKGLEVVLGSEDKLISISTLLNAEGVDRISGALRGVLNTLFPFVSKSLGLKECHDHAVQHEYSKQTYASLLASHSAFQYPILLNAKHMDEHGIVMKGTMIGKLGDDQEIKTQVSGSTVLSRLMQLKPDLYVATEPVFSSFGGRNGKALKRGAEMETGSQLGIYVRHMAMLNKLHEPTEPGKRGGSAAAAEPVVESHTESFL